MPEITSLDQLLDALLNLPYNDVHSWSRPDQKLPKPAPETDAIFSEVARYIPGFESYPRDWQVKVARDVSRTGIHGEQAERLLKAAVAKALPARLVEQICRRLETLPSQKHSRLLALVITAIPGKDRGNAGQQLAKRRVAVETALHVIGDDFPDEGRVSEQDPDYRIMKGLLSVSDARRRIIHRCLLVNTQRHPQLTVKQAADLVEVVVQLSDDQLNSNRWNILQNPEHDYLGRLLLVLQGLLNQSFEPREVRAQEINRRQSAISGALDQLEKLFEDPQLGLSKTALGVVRGALEQVRGVVSERPSELGR